MDIKVQLLIYLAVVSISDSYYSPPHLRGPAVYLKHGHRRLNSPKCVCFHGFQTDLSIIQKINPNNNQLQRLVVYFYIDPTTNGIYTYVPNANTQIIFPELSLEPGDSLQLVTTDSIRYIINTHSKRVTSVINNSKIPNYNNHPNSNSNNVAPISVSEDQPLPYDPNDPHALVRPSIGIPDNNAPYAPQSLTEAEIARNGNDPSNVSQNYEIPDPSQTQTVSHEINNGVPQNSTTFLPYQQQSEVNSPLPDPTHYQEYTAEIANEPNLLNLSNIERHKYNIVQYNNPNQHPEMSNSYEPQVGHQQVTIPESNQISENTVNGPDNRHVVSPAEASAPNNDSGPFFNWLREQKLKDFNPSKVTINITVLRRKVKQLLQQQGFIVTQSGSLSYINGHNINWSNVMLQTILIGQPIHYQRIMNLNGILKLDTNVPHLKALLVSLKSPSRIIGVIPVEKVYIRDNALSSDNWTGTVPIKKDLVCPGCSQFVVPLKVKDQAIFNQLQEFLSGQLHQVQLIKSTSKANPHQNSQWYYSTTASPERRFNSDAAIKKQTPLVFHKSSNPLKGQKDSIPESTTRKSIKTYNSEDKGEKVKNGRRNIASGLVADLLGVMEKVLNLGLPPPKQQEAENGVGFRIIGGAAATSSGAPLSFKGRSGFIE